MNYLLDTNAVIAILKNDPPAVRARLRRALGRRDEVSISSIVLFELAYGVARSERRKENSERLRVFLSGDIGTEAFDGADAMTAGEIRANLAKAGTPIGPYDVLIAAQAQRKDATVVTANTGEFARVRGLKCQDWARR